LWTVQKHISSTVLQKCFILEYMKHLTTDTWDTLIEKSRNSSGLRCTLDGRRGTTCLEEAIEKKNHQSTNGNIWKLSNMLFQNKSIIKKNIYAIFFGNVF
jgi:hypothetical protein